jgi:hypothetical protein
MYVKVNNGSPEIYPYTIGQLRKDNSNTSFPKMPSEELLSQYGVYLVVPSSKPEYDEKTQGIVEDSTPAEIGGKWVLGWSVYNKSSSEISRDKRSKANILRSQRNDLLAKCDWTQLPDSPLSEEKQAEWKAYRQALRSVSELEDFPYVELPPSPDQIATVTTIPK